MSVRKLFAILVAFAVLLAPAFTRAGQASAAMPDHHTQMMESGHCESPSSDKDQSKKPAQKSCCASMCLGVAIAPPSPLHVSKLPPTPAVSFIPPLHLAYLGEMATPPPRPA
jgi:hypothetical protein